MPLPLAAIPAIIQGGIGLSQLLGGAFAKVPDRPTYEIPSALSEQVNIANREANASLAPGQAMAQNKIEGASANAINSLKQATTNSSDLINSIGMVQQSQNRGLSDLYMQSFFIETGQGQDNSKLYQV